MSGFIKPPCFLLFLTFPPSFPHAFERGSSDFNILEPLDLCLKTCREGEKKGV
jgi:hypothetical protein